MNMKNIKINSQKRSNFLIGKSILHDNFQTELSEITREHTKACIHDYMFYFYELHKPIVDEDSHREKIDNLPNKQERITASIKKCFDEYITKCGKEALAYLKQDIVELVKKYQLGNEFIEPLFTLSVSGYWDPPKMMFNIRPLEECKNSNSIILEIGQQTTLKDIKENWNEIEKIRKKIWPENKIERITKKTLEDDAIWLASLLIKHNAKIKNEENEILGIDKDGSYLEDEDIDKKYFEKDVFVMQEIWPDASSPKTDKKRINRLRTIRSRVKKKNMTIRRP